jgi:hypothetical protein
MRPRLRRARGWVLRTLQGEPAAPGDAELATMLEPELRALAARHGGEAALAEKVRHVEARSVEFRMLALKEKLAQDDISQEEARELARLQSEAQRLQELATRPH